VFNFCVFNSFGLNFPVQFQHSNSHLICFQKFSRMGKTDPVSAGAVLVLKQ
jgi:hypothetical protein